MNRAAQTEEVLFLRSEPDFHLARRRVARGARVRVAIDGMSDAEHALWEARINRHARACGCELGTIFAALAIVAYAAYVLGARDTARLDWLPALGVGLLVVGSAAALGKTVGLGYARIRLASLLSALRARARDAH